jgi:carbonic anhydrase
VDGGDPLSSGDFIGQWMRDVHDVAESVRHDHDARDLQTAVEHASVEHSLANLRTFPWLRQRENRSDLTVHGAWFDIALGELHTYDETGKSWAVIPSSPTT